EWGMVGRGTGLRGGEPFGRTWAQVLPRGLIDTLTKAKSGRPGMAPITQRVGTILGTLTRRLDTPYVIVNPDTGSRYWQRNKGFKEAMRRAGIVDLEWHDRRRTAGCRWLQRGGKSMEEVSDLAGTSSVEVTQKSYAFLDQEAVAQSLSGRTKTGTGTSDIITFPKAKQ